MRSRCDSLLSTPIRSTTVFSPPFIGTLLLDWRRQDMTSMIAIFTPNAFSRFSPGMSGDSTTTLGQTGEMSSRTWTVFSAPKASSSCSLRGGMARQRY
jgi:hypothetical protein